MLKKKNRPSASKLFFDQRVIPFAANAASRFEVTLDRASVRSGVRPSVIVAGGAGLLSLLVFYLARRRNFVA